MKFGANFSRHANLLSVTKRFENRIIQQWQKNGFKYNSGHVQLLRFAWIASLYWDNVRGEKIAEKNKMNTNQLTIW